MHTYPRHQGTSVFPQLKPAHRWAEQPNLARLWAVLSVRLAVRRWSGSVRLVLCRVIGLWARCS